MTVKWSELNKLLIKFTLFYLWCIFVTLTTHTSTNSFLLYVCIYIHVRNWYNSSLCIPLTNITHECEWIQTNAHMVITNGNPLGCKPQRRKLKICCLGNCLRKTDLWATKLLANGHLLLSPKWRKEKKEKS